MTETRVFRSYNRPVDFANDHHHVTRADVKKHTSSKPYPGGGT